MKPLADRIRPDKLEEIVGQGHILGKGKILSQLIENKKIMNMIFYGPPGVGKTTVADLISKGTNKQFYRLNATTASIKDIHEIAKKVDSLMGMNGILLYLDEIQNFNKKQQQSLLEFIEDGRITLIASTTENPYHYIYNAILSRSMVFEFKPIEEKDIIKGLKRAEELIKKDLAGETLLTIEEEVFQYIALMSGGDLRKALNMLELSIYATPISAEERIRISIDIVKNSIQQKSFNFDKGGDYYYDALSALQKSIRGSDPDAAIFYAALLLKGGQMQALCRRLLVTASEDIGLAYPNGASIVYALVQSAFQLGMPEARIPIAQAVILLATAPKSNSAYRAIDQALQDINTKDIGEIPLHLRDNHYCGADKLNRVGYKYPHDYRGHYVKQQYLPDSLSNTTYYRPCDNKMERAIKAYLENLNNDREQ